jgi:hypothetical protein
MGDPCNHCAVGNIQCIRDEKHERCAECTHHDDQSHNGPVFVPDSKWETLVNAENHINAQLEEKHGFVMTRASGTPFMFFIPYALNISHHTTITWITHHRSYQKDMICEFNPALMARLLWFLQRILQSFLWPRHDDNIDELTPTESNNKEENPPI